MRVTLLRQAANDGFGGATYVDRVAAGLQAAKGVDLDELFVSTWRGSRRGDIGLPTRLLHALPPLAVRTMGNVLWRGRNCHRMSLTLPPSTNEIVSVLDLAPHRFSDEGRLPAYAMSSISRARGVMCLSNFIASEVSTLGARRTWTAPPGVDERFFLSAGLERSQRSGLKLGDAPFVLHTGGLTERKGATLLADAWRLCVSRGSDLQLVMTGPQSPARALFAQLPRTHYLGRVSDQVQAALVHSAARVVVSSTYEGWGMPAAEALAAGTEVVAVNASSLPEVVGEHGVLVDATPSALGTALSPPDRGELPLGVREARRSWARQFTWDRAVAAHLSAYDEVFDT